MRCLVYIAVFMVLTGCTATRTLSKKFSGQATSVEVFVDELDFANVPIDTVGNYGRILLWNKLLQYRSEKDSLPQVSERAVIRIRLASNNRLIVTASEDHQAIARFEISVRKRRKYLILENKNHVVPIPIIYFSIKEQTTVLARLDNQRIGIYDYRDESLWILFFGASNTAASLYEYNSSSL